MEEHKDRGKDSSNNSLIIHLIHTRANRVNQKLMSLNHTLTQDKTGLNKLVNRTILNLDKLILRTLDL